MYNKWKSRIINNGIIFLVGMVCAFFVFSFVINDSIITANIWDAFTTRDDKPSHFVLSLDENNILSLVSSLDIPSGRWKSLRISLLYNDSLKDMMSGSLQSSYDFSFMDKNNALVLLINMDGQDIEQWKKIFSLPLMNTISQDIPIIESMTLFDQDQIDILSVENKIISSTYH